jgi:hypothetical protein
MGAKINAGNARSYEFFDGGRAGAATFFYSGFPTPF